ncbi:MAG TPA: hypothetical protein DCR71_00030 [Dehalococcoidia bacterium]|nr:hypothetical protein [Dehalococcoidia bacterium]
MKHPLTAPIIILIVLLLAWVFRWDYVATKTLDDGATVIRYKTDRWTGYKWFDVYSVKNEIPSFSSPIYKEDLQSAQGKKAWRLDKIAKIIWYSLAGLDAVWIAFTVILLRRKTEAVAP